MPNACDPSAVATGQRAQSSWAHASSFEDIDAQAAHFEGYGQHYEQLSAGPFRGSFRSYEFGRRLNVHLESANRRLMQCASTPAGRFGFSIVLPHSPSCVFNGMLVRDGDIILYPAGTTIQGTTPEGMRLFCVDIEAEQVAGLGFEAGPIRIAREVEHAGRLHELIASGVDAFTRLGSPADYETATVDFCTSLTELVWRLSNSSLPVTGYSGKERRRLAFSVHLRARDLMIDRLENGVSIVAICRDVGVSRRSLECAFRTAIGMGPAQYIRKLQLNRVRRELLTSQNTGSSIGTLAARHGVWHWSRFSQGYREMFGELPRETRARALAR